MNARKDEPRMQPLLKELEQLITDLKQKEQAAIFTVPEEVIVSIKKSRNLENLLLDILNTVQGSSGVDIVNILRREFGISKILTDRFVKWAAHSKEQLADALHDAIDRAEIRAGKQGLFFTGSPVKEEATEALALLKEIAHAAVRLQFNSRYAGPDVYVDLQENLLRFHELPNTFPDSGVVKYRSLLSENRLFAMSGKDQQITEALKASTRAWYQRSSLAFLENREWYPDYDYVKAYLYLLTVEQLERLRDDFIRYIGEEFTKLKAKPELHRAESLKSMLETALGWSV
ncbi:hypothetical protein FPZ49_25485 [Paenibacillus cremeus]|uniref:Uncharacterized protein n=2 Tax=Paenibacillus cremeus TaxID=2163881 RepID=A0A559K4S1_9BACL|nr:hypothetical protein FPZ49_25485 [Paenibacillus cremeus]